MSIGWAAAHGAANASAPHSAHSSEAAPTHRSAPVRAITSRVQAAARVAPGGILAGVHPLDQLRVAGRDRLALELHRRRQLLAAGQPVARDDLKALEPFDAR